jgi:hypothetical protein
LSKSQKNFNYGNLFLLKKQTVRFKKNAKRRTTALIFKSHRLVFNRKKTFFFFANFCLFLFLKFSFFTQTRRSAPNAYRLQTVFIANFNLFFLLRPRVLLDFNYSTFSNFFLNNFFILKEFFCFYENRSTALTTSNSFFFSQLPVSVPPYLTVQTIKKQKTREYANLSIAKGPRSFFNQKFKRSSDTVASPVLRKYAHIWFLKKNHFTPLAQQAFFNYFGKKQIFVKKKKRRKAALDLFKISIFEYMSDSIIRVTRSSRNYNLTTLKLIKFSFFYSYRQFLFTHFNLFSKNTQNVALIAPSAFCLPNVNLFELHYGIFSPKCALLKKRMQFFRKFNNSLKSQKANRAVFANKLFFNSKTHSIFSKNDSFLDTKKYFFLEKNVIKKTMFYFFNSTSVDKLLLFWSKPFFFKYFFFYFQNVFSTHEHFLDKRLFFTNSTFSPFSHHKNLFFTNIFYEKNFLFIIKKYAVKSFAFFKFPLLNLSWHYLTLMKFLEFMTGKKIYLKFYALISTELEPFENARCVLWSYRLRSFKRAFGAKLFLIESLKILYSSLKYKDIYFLSDWMLKFFYKISFWKYKMIFRYLYYVLRYFFQPFFPEIRVKGIKFQLKGKVSVAGNARTRVVRNHVGNLSHSTYNNKILTNLNFLRTFTGVIGFRTWLSF